MKTLILALILTIPSLATANDTQYDIRKRQLLQLICQRSASHADLLRDLEEAKVTKSPLTGEINQFKVESLQAKVDAGDPDFEKLKQYYPKWFGKAFDPKDCP